MDPTLTENGEDLDVVEEVLQPQAQTLDPPQANITATEAVPMTTTDLDCHLDREEAQYRNELEKSKAKMKPLKWNKEELETQILEVI
mmetsp:Transcript_6363/g.8012  ORF Transcript_6363/g.8012 Transcript_6363/m.8012 type:complete len:87 (+) Transcript_6363:407-667(+)|eukprot:CAMPEP_0172510266 /NCGR_PEP_ID=MMETSP1066-20121228/227454_1 /TAXON_ID=671091 /ORGANISM="Coscinodiscus wailesii, Strain CCMP2513" /LENGTH=86 /DNA_ID=CAMNT_0013289151 /DNA_START=404 /DNA_END=664 /DNA_ORIENTATION=+